MKATELIKKLQEIIEKHGDKEVQVGSNFESVDLVLPLIDNEEDGITYIYISKDTTF